MKKGTLKSWLRLALIMVCGIVALVLIIAEPNVEGSMLKWFGVFMATKFAAIVCGFVAYQQLQELTKEVEGCVDNATDWTDE